MYFTELHRLKVAYRNCGMVLPDMDSAQFYSMRETAQRCLNSSLFSLSTLGGNTISVCVFMAGLGPSVMLCLWTNSLHFILRSQICMVKSLGLSDSEEIQICSLVCDSQYSHVTDGASETPSTGSGD